MAHESIEINVEIVAKHATPGSEFKQVYKMPLRTQKTVSDSLVTAATGGGTTITTAGDASGSSLLIQNTDATNYVDITFRTAASAGDEKVRLLAGELVLLPTYLYTTNPVLVANTAACICRVVRLYT